MLDIIQSLSNNSNIDLSAISAINTYSSNSDSTAFNMVLESLLKAMKEQNQSTRSTSGDLSLDNVLGSLNKLSFNSENIDPDRRIESAVSTYSNKYGVDSDLIRAVIKAESNFNAEAVSSAGAAGLMQIMPDNFSSLGISNPFNVDQNIEGGTKLLKQYLDMYDQDVEMALMAYNGGPGTMASRGVVSCDDIYKMPKETQNYVPKVMSYYRGL